MPETNVLYSVTAVVVLALVAWVAYVLKSASEPWQRSVAPLLAVPAEDGEARGADEPAGRAKAEVEAPGDDANG